MSDCYDGDADWIYDWDDSDDGFFPDDLYWPPVGEDDIPSMPPFASLFDTANADAQDFIMRLGFKQNPVYSFPYKELSDKNLSSKVLSF